MMMPHENEFCAQKKDLALPEVKTGLWDVSVFINAEKNAQPLDEYFAGLSKYLERTDYSGRIKTAHVAKVFPCNSNI